MIYKEIETQRESFSCWEILLRGRRQRLVVHPAHCSLHVVVTRFVTKVCRAIVTRDHCHSAPPPSYCLGQVVLTLWAEWTLSKDSKIKQKDTNLTLGCKIKSKWMFDNHLLSIYLNPVRWIRIKNWSAVR